MTSFPYASPQWCAAMREILEKLVAEHGHGFPDANFAMCEIISDVPPDGAHVVLGARFTGGSVRFFDSEEDANVVIHGDYEAMLPGAKFIRRTATPEAAAAQAAHSKKMAAAGRVSARGDMSAAPKPLLRVLGLMHDQLAVITA